MITEKTILPEEEAIFTSLDNCWLALCQRMRENPTAETQRVMNLLARIITTAKSETISRRNAAKKEVSTEEWIKWFLEG